MSNFSTVTFGGSKKIVVARKFRRCKSKANPVRPVVWEKTSRWKVETDHGSETNHEVSSGWWWKRMDLVDLGWLVGLEFVEERKR